MSTGLSCLSEEVCQHKLLAARAVVTGWIAVSMLWTVVALRLAHIDEWLFVTGLADIRAFWRGGTAPFSHLLIGGLLNAVAGWLVGWSHQRHKVAMVSAFFLSFVLVADLPRLIDVGAEAVQSGSTSWRGLQICLLDFLFMSLPILIAGTCGVRNMPVTRPANNRS
jgi:hypothetical protein